MFEDIKKGMMAGLGAVLLTKNKVEEIIRKTVAETKISEDEARKLRDELIEAGEQQVSKLENTVTEIIHRNMESLGLGRKDELDKLKQKIEAFETRISVLEKEETGKE